MPLRAKRKSRDISPGFFDTEKSLYFPQSVKIVLNFNTVLFYAQDNACIYQAFSAPSSHITPS